MDKHLGNHSQRQFPVPQGMTCKVFKTQGGDVDVPQLWADRTLLSTCTLFTAPPPALFD